jgi:16S rRNA (uracil1498-N3)-methyltransferase
MKRVLCARLPQPGRLEPVAAKEAEHLTRVLRLRDGDELEALDGQGHAAKVTLRLRGGAPFLEFLENVASSGPAGVVSLTLEMAILKGEAMEWVVEKAVELGVKTLVPLVTVNTVVQIKNKGPEAFRERWQKIADQALKQCGRFERLEVLSPVAFKDWVATPLGAPRLWCDETAKGAAAGSTDLAQWLLAAKGLQKCSLLIGPEGGWNEVERHLLEADSKLTARISLGPYILRGETAALYAVSLVIASLRQTT